MNCSVYVGPVGSISLRRPNALLCLATLWIGNNRLARVYVDAEGAYEVMQLIGLAIFIFVGFVGFPFPRHKPYLARLRSRFSPRQEVAFNAAGLLGPKLADALDAIVDVILIVLMAHFVRPRINVMAAFVFCAVVNAQIPPIAVLVSDVHPNAAKLETDGLEDARFV